MTTHTAPIHRPVQISHAGDSHHVVHGDYGVVLLGGHQPQHLTCHWSSARPYTLICTLTDLPSGDRDDWYLLRSLLRDGGRHRTLKIDHIGRCTFVVVEGTTRHRWFCLNSQWLAAFIRTTDALVPPGTGQRFTS